MQRIKHRLGIGSNVQLIVIFIVFTLTGSTSVYVAKPLLHLVGLDLANFPVHWWGTSAYWTLRLLMIVTIYQVLLLLFGWLLGQFQFFWKMEKKLLLRIGLGFIFSKS